MDFFKNVDNFKKYNEVNSIVKFKSEISKPIFSILIPTYNREEYLLQALESAINQRFALQYEIIIVDNNPISLKNKLSDNLLNFLIKHNNISYYVNEKNIGLFGNWNRAVELANADWICYLHDDDTIKEDYLLTMYEVINSKKNRNINFLFTNLDTLEINNKQRKFNISYSFVFKNIYSIFIPSIQKISKYHFITGNKTHLPGAVILKSKIIEIGGFNEYFYPASDYSFAAFFYNEFKGIYKVKKPLYKYRIDVNLSLRPDVIIQCAKHDFLLRNYLINKWKFKFRFLLGLSSYLFKEKMDKNFSTKYRKPNLDILYRLTLFIFKKYDWFVNINIYSKR